MQLTFYRRRLSRQHGFIGWRFESSELLHRLVEGFFRLAELNHADLKITERTLDQAVPLLVVSQEVMP